MSSLQTLQQRADALQQQYNTAKALVRAEGRALQAAKARLATATTAHAIAQQVAQQVQQAIHQQIATTVSRCLAAVFPEPYGFEIKWERARGKTEARMVFTRSGEELEPLEAAGLGVADVAAFALRTAALILGRPPRRKLLVLDEPFKFLSAEHQPAAAKLLELLSSELGVQFLIVTHLPELEIGNVIKL